MKILVVDDDPMTLMTISKKLRERGYEVEPASNSIEAVKIVGNKKIDFVISDILMPGISGFTLLVMLKNFYFLKVPVILISSYKQENVLLRSYNLMASDFVGKPIDYDELFLKIEEHAKKAS